MLMIMHNTDVGRAVRQLQKFEMLRHQGTDGEVVGEALWGFMMCGCLLSYCLEEEITNAEE